MEILRFYFFRFLYILDRNRNVGRVLGIADRRAVRIINNMASAIINGTTLQRIMNAGLHAAIANESRTLATTNSVIGVLLVLAIISRNVRTTRNALLIL